MGSLSVSPYFTMKILIDKTSENPNIFDTSELLRPEEALKDKDVFRDYSKDDIIGERVKKTYFDMHTNQTVEFVKKKHEMLNELVDESDPDLDLPNIVHAFQTAER